MEHFLALTLAGRLPYHFHGETAHFRPGTGRGGDPGADAALRAANAGLVLPCAIHVATKRRRWR